MKGSCPFSSQWRQAEDTKKPTSSALPTPDGDQQVHSLAPKCPVLGYGATVEANGESSFNDGHASCPLGFGSGSNYTPSAVSLSRSGIPRMSLEILAAHHKKQETNLRLLSIKGVVFDVSEDPEFNIGGAFERLPGHDASRFVALSAQRASIGDGDDDFHSLDTGLEGLTYQDHRRLETYYHEMLRGRRVVAVLADEDITRIFGTPLDPSGESTVVDDQAGVIQSPPPSPAATLHVYVEQGKAESVRQLLRHNVIEEENRREGVTDGVEDAPNFDCAEGKDKLLVEAVCPRTGMTPLLKAIEGAAEDVVRALLEAGADVRAKAKLYDNDDSIALAKRLGVGDEIISLLLPHYAADEGYCR